MAGNDQSEAARPAKKHVEQRSSSPPTNPPLPTLLDSIRKTTWNSVEHKQATNFILRATASQNQPAKEEFTPFRRTGRSVCAASSNKPKGLAFIEDTLKLVNPGRDSTPTPEAVQDEPSSFRVAKGRARKVQAILPRRHQPCVHQYVYVPDSESDDEDDDEFAILGPGKAAVSSQGTQIVKYSSRVTSGRTQTSKTPPKNFGCDLGPPFRANKSLIHEDLPIPTRSKATEVAAKYKKRKAPSTFAVNSRTLSLKVYDSISGDDDTGSNCVENENLQTETITPAIFKLHKMSSAAAALGVTTSAQSRSLRACMVCCIVRPFQQFMNEGCPNCEPALQMRGLADTVNECTSSNFNGVIALMTPGESWVAKYHRLDGYVQGMYAVQVIGNLPDDTIDQVRQAGMRFVRRDGRKDEDDEGLEA